MQLLDFGGVTGYFRLHDYCYINVKKTSLFPHWNLKPFFKRYLTCNPLKFILIVYRARNNIYGYKVTGLVDVFCLYMGIYIQFQPLYTKINSLKCGGGLC